MRVYVDTNVLIDFSLSSLPVYTANELFAFFE